MLTANNEHMNVFGCGNTPPTHRPSSVYVQNVVAASKLKVLDHPKTLHFKIKVIWNESI